MGQYYNILTQNKQGKFKLYNRSVNNEYMFAKLTEHSWIGNDFMDSFCNLLINNPIRIAWVGDYANDLEELPNEIDSETLKELYKKTYKTLKAVTVDKADLDYEKYYLVNHTKNIYIDLSTYIKENIYKDHFDWNWCLHPLSLLTALGNGLGGGDYHGTNESLIGSWAWDYISLEEKETFNNTGYVKAKYNFKENY